MDLLLIAGLRRNSMLGFVFSVVTVSLAFILRLAAADYFDPFPYLLFMPPVVISAFFGGIGPGLLSLFLSCALVQFHLYWDGSPPFTAVQVIGLAGFILNGIILIALIDGLLRILAEKADHERQLLEFRAQFDRMVEERTEQLKLEMSEHVSTQSQMRELQKIETIGQLTGGLAHDFNNMLAVIIGSLDIAERRLARGQSDEVATLLGNARDGAKRAASLTSRLLAFSRRQTLRPEIVDTATHLERLPEMLARHLEPDIAIELKIAEGLWPLFADPAQLEQAILNLVLNAGDAMPEGGLVTISAENAELDAEYLKEHPEVRPGDYIRIAVSDTGIGMAPKVIERVFDPFFTTKGPGNGAGLGLSQVFGWVKQTGGHIRLQSAPGRGTTVFLYLPRHTGQAMAHDPAHPLPEGVAERMRDEVVLVVEDEDNVRHMTVEALRELGYTVVEASGGRDALQQITHHIRIDLLFTDVVMPDMNGKLVADAVRDRFPGVKVIFTTGYTRNAIVQNGTVEPGVNLLLKPFTLEQLSSKITEILRHK